jgi:hypothetical protein
LIGANTDTALQPHNKVVNAKPSILFFTVSKHLMRSIIPTWDLNFSI